MLLPPLWLPGQEEHFNKVIDGLQAMSRQLAPLEAAMQPVQVSIKFEAMVNIRGLQAQQGLLWMPCVWLLWPFVTGCMQHCCKAFQ